jgi:integrase
MTARLSLRPPSTTPDAGRDRGAFRGRTNHQRQSAASREKVGRRGEFPERETVDRVYPSSWKKETGPIREYLDMAFAEGLRLSSADNDRYTLRRYCRFLKERFNKDLPEAGWQECASYRNYLLGQNLKKRTITHYVDIIRRYYLLRVRRSGDPYALDTYTKIRVIGRNLQNNTRWEGHTPFSPETLRRIVRAAQSYKQIRCNCHLVDSEDRVVIMTFLYTGGRSAFYGLRVKEIDFDRGEIRTRVKGGHLIVIPLHPKLAEVLRRHLATRKYQSPFVFRKGGDPATLEGQIANRVNALHACKRVQRAAGLKESVYPYRFRRTFAVMARELGLDMQQVQCILGHSNILTTYNVYAKPRMEEVTRAFARVDFLRPRRKPDRNSIAQIVTALQQLAPAGKEEAWATLVQGFAELFRRSDRVPEPLSLGDIWSTKFRYMRR